MKTAHGVSVRRFFQMASEGYNETDQTDFWTEMTEFTESKNNQINQLL